MIHHILIMGVSGSGKSTIGKKLAEELKLTFIDADHLHPTSNKAKMAKGIPLDDADREDWLLLIADTLAEYKSKGFVLACSALKKNYRDKIASKLSIPLHIFHLTGNKDLIASRMKQREHFMPVTLLDSQFEILEISEDLISVDIHNKEENITAEIISKLTKKAAIGIIGLGVMGKSLARNFASKNIPVTVYNLPLQGEEDVVSNFVKNHFSEYIIAAGSLSDFLHQLENPKIILLMIKSGEPVDEMIKTLKEKINKGDIIIDAGNSFFKDSMRRHKELQEAGIDFVGMGVSGGEEGALLGPSLMPAGSETAKNILMPLLSKIAAKADGQDCVTWVGKNAEGHFVKMLHNGIEYADMQIIAECYAIAKTCLAMNNDTIANMFDEWNKTEAASYLLEISSAILRFMENDEYLIDKILDVAESKGTALWTLQEALELGVPTPSLHAAISQRMLSAQKNIRTTLSVKQSKQKLAAPFSDTDALLSSMIFTRLVAMAEGMHLLEAASKKYDWQIDLPSLLQSWRGGCIIRSELLLKAIEACKSKKSSEHLFQTEIFETMLSKYRSDAAQVISQAHQNGITVPALSAAINYYDAMHTSYLPLNLVQAQRDYFGAHTYRKLDAGQEAFHTNWK